MDRSRTRPPRDEAARGRSRASLLAVAFQKKTRRKISLRPLPRNAPRASIGCRSSGCEIGSADSGLIVERIRRNRRIPVLELSTEKGIIERKEELNELSANGTEDRPVKRSIDRPLELNSSSRVDGRRDKGQGELPRETRHSAGYQKFLRTDRLTRLGELCKRPRGQRDGYFSVDVPNHVH